MGWLFFSNRLLPEYVQYIHYVFCILPFFTTWALRIRRKGYTCWEPHKDVPDFPPQGTLVVKCSSFAVKRVSLLSAPGVTTPRAYSNSHLLRTLRYPCHNFNTDYHKWDEVYFYEPLLFHLLSYSVPSLSFTSLFDVICQFLYIFKLAAFQVKDKKNILCTPFLFSFFKCEFYNTGGRARLCLYLFLAGLCEDFLQPDLKWWLFHLQLPLLHTTFKKHPNEINVFLSMQF